MFQKRIPFLDLPKLHHPLKKEILKIVEAAIDSAHFIGGTTLDQFETAFAKYCNTQYCSGVASGTDALVLALRALGVKAGDTVITVPNTFIATTEAISQVGAKIAFVDVDPDTCLMSPVKLQQRIRELQGQVKAIIPVHLYGQMADMQAIMDIANEFGIKVLEDAAQAHGAEQNGKRAGSLGHAAAFSFYPGKNLGACGEGGAVTTNNEAVMLLIKQLRDHGQSKKYYHALEGYNARLDAIQAGILNLKLEHLENWNISRRKTAQAFDTSFANFKHVHPVRMRQENQSSRHLYVVHTSDRKALATHLSNANIDSALHYPVPLHLQECYMKLGFSKGSFPNAEQSATTLLSLPIFPDMTQEQIDRIIAVVTKYEKEICK